MSKRYPRRTVKDSLSLYIDKWIAGRFNILYIGNNNIATANVVARQLQSEWSNVIIQVERFKKYDNTYKWHLDSYDTISLRTYGKPIQEN